MRVVIGSINENVVKLLSQFFMENGLRVVGATSSGHGLLRKVHTVYPDIVIIDHKIKGMTGYELSETIIFEKTCPVITLINSAQVGDYINLSQEPTFVSLIKPIGKTSLINTIGLLVKTSKSIAALEKELKVVKTDKNAKAIIAKAKLLLMEHVALTEEEAHRIIQKKSMDKSISKVKIAESIIQMYG